MHKLFSDYQLVSDVKEMREIMKIVGKVINNELGHMFVKVVNGEVISVKLCSIKFPFSYLREDNYVELVDNIF